MTYSINRTDMLEKMEKALRLGGNLYTFHDVMGLINQGKMQSFVNGDTWIITQVHEYPLKKVVAITFVVGNLNEAVEALSDIYEFARSIDATMVTAWGRDGWWKFAQPGWKKLGSVYMKDLRQ